MTSDIQSPQDIVDEVTRRIQQMTYGRIRDLAVEHVQGKVIVRGSVPSHHVRQLALQGALQLLPAETCQAMITVG